MSVKLQHLYDQTIYNFAKQHESLANGSESSKNRQNSENPQKPKRTLPKMPSPSGLRQAINHLRVYFEYFCEKYDIEADEEEIARLMALAETVKEVAFRNKGNCQLVGAVIYCQYGKSARFSNPKEFCRKNALNVRTFNKKFTLYRKINRIVPSCSEQDDTIQDMLEMGIEQTGVDGDLMDEQQLCKEEEKFILEDGMK